MTIPSRCLIRFPSIAPPEGFEVQYEIDNKLENLNINFDKAYVKAQNIISNWKAHKLPINGRIIISKSLVVSQFNYVASIIPPPAMLKNAGFIKQFHKRR